jgi:hypothetical protein
MAERTKFFEGAKVNDKVYKLSLVDSVIYRYPNSEAIKELTISSIVRYPSNLYLNLSDGVTTITPRRALASYVNERDDDEIGLSIDVYALTKRECISAAIAEINKRRTKIRGIEKRCRESDSELDIATLELMNIRPDEQEVMSEEEFANAALE